MSEYSPVYRPHRQRREVGCGISPPTWFQGGMAMLVATCTHIYTGCPEIGGVNLGFIHGNHEKLHVFRAYMKIFQPIQRICLLPNTISCLTISCDYSSAKATTNAMMDMRISSVLDSSGSSNAMNTGRGVIDNTMYAAFLYL